MYDDVAQLVEKRFLSLLSEWLMSSVTERRQASVEAADILVLRCRVWVCSAHCWRRGQQWVRGCCFCFRAWAVSQKGKVAMEWGKSCELGSSGAGQRGRWC